MNRLAAIALFSVACGREPRLVTAVVTPPAHVDAGTLPRPSACNVPFGGPECCDGSGARVGSATCRDDAYVCSTGAPCSCNGEPQTFFCTDFCGSDAYVSPICGGDGWLCPGGLIATSSCPAGTCFGEPGDLCAAPMCIDGNWVCMDDDGGVRDPEN